METILALLAGFFAGASLLLVFAFHRLYRFHQSNDAERKRLWNKLLVRDGQQTLFTEQEITGTEEPKREPSPTVHTISSPFRRRQQQMKENLKQLNKTEAGNHLPAEMKASIAAAAEEIRNGHNG